MVKIAAGEFNTPLLYEDEQVIAFKDINPVTHHLSNPPSLLFFIKLLVF